MCSVALFYALDPNFPEIDLQPQLDDHDFPLIYESKAGWLSRSWFIDYPGEAPEGGEYPLYTVYDEDTKKLSGRVQWQTDLYLSLAIPLVMNFIKFIPLSTAKFPKNEV